MNWVKYSIQRRKLERKRKARLNQLMQKGQVLSFRETIMLTNSWNGRRRRVNSLVHGYDSHY